VTIRNEKGTDILGACGQLREQNRSWKKDEKKEEKVFKF
jgi:adenine C2-methylase RlmN of 23S rRNA A2503 and tRNA A37